MNFTEEARKLRKELFETYGSERTLVSALQAAYESGKAEERERWEREARRYAEFYAQGTDGRNTFIIFADAIREAKP